MKILESLFRTILEMSLTGCFVIGVVLAARLCLRRAPRIFSYCLWAAVFFRLCCPVSFESAVSLLPRLSAGTADSGTGTNFIPMLPALPGQTPAGTVPAVPDAPAGVPAATAPSMFYILSIIWIAGILLLLGYSVFSSLRLKSRLKNAVHREGNIYELPGLPTPFVLGFFRPRIYLPAGLNPGEERYILLHEQTHIRRRDYLIKPAAFLALCIHWFNPLCWIAFWLMTVDMEMSCDERVLKELGSGIKKEYSASLLSLAAGRKISIGGPLAFGEGSVKSRIRNVLNYKRPAFWLILLALAAVAALVFCLVSNPRAEEAGSPGGVSDPAAEQLNIEKVLALSQKGEELTWKDLEKYQNIGDIGSGLYIVGYPLEETGWMLRAGGNGPGQPFRYVTLEAPSGNTADIRTDDLEAFLKAEREAYYPDSTTFAADLNHDGNEEKVVTDFSQLEDGNGQIFIRVEDTDGNILWSVDDISTSHAGWIVYSLCTLDGKDYLMRYAPYIYQGYANYDYEVFSLNAQGEPQSFATDAIEFAIGAGPAGDTFNPEEIANFTRKVNSYMSTGRLLCSTLNGAVAFTPEGDHWTLLEYMDWLDDETLSCGKDADLLVKLKAYQKEILEPAFAAYWANRYCDILTSTVVYENGQLSFTIPDGDRPEGFALQLSGRLNTGGGMSWHAFEEETAHGGWTPGKTYSTAIAPETIDSISLSIEVLLENGSFSREYTLSRDENGELSWRSQDKLDTPEDGDTAAIASGELPVTLTAISYHLSRMVPEEVSGQYSLPYYMNIGQWNKEAVPRYQEYSRYFAKQSDLFPTPVADGAMLQLDFGKFVPDTLTVQKLNGVPADVKVNDGGFILLRAENKETEAVYSIHAAWKNGNEVTLYISVKYL